jgi:hypothetical protein
MFINRFSFASSIQREEAELLKFSNLFYFPS